MKILKDILYKVSILEVTGSTDVPVREVCKNWSQVLQQHAGSEVPITNHGEVIAYLRVLPRKKG